MGLEVFQGPTQFRVAACNVDAFERVFGHARLDDYWTLTRDRNGAAITGLELRCVPGALCEFGQMEALACFVEAGSFVTLESFWGDDVWRWCFHGDTMSEETVPLDER